MEGESDPRLLKAIAELTLPRRSLPQLAAVHLMDAHHITDAGKYVALLLLSLRTMLQMELPHINVLSKVDLLQGAGDLRTFLLSLLLRPYYHADEDGDRQHSTSTSTPKSRIWSTSCRCWSKIRAQSGSRN